MLGLPRGFDYPQAMFWKSLSTPCALVDLERVEANSNRMSARVDRLGARLRPHVKTHKCVEAARFQTRGHFGGITVSTLAEAAAFAKAGFRDITYGVPVNPGRLEDVGALTVLPGLDVLHVLFDHEATLFELEKYGVAQAIELSAYLKVDCGHHRAGVDPKSENSIRLVRRAHEASAVQLKGILTHAGHSYGCSTREEILAVAEQERVEMVRFANKLDEAGLAVEEVSVGSTPTMSLTENLEGVTEARPGNYVFFDAFQASIGSCDLSDLAFSVLVTVIGQYPERNETLIDAGALAFSKDAGARHLDAECGFGMVFSASGQSHYPDVRLQSLSQEHGKLVGLKPLDFDQFAVGNKLRIVPNHSCLAAAMFDRYHVFRQKDVVDEWKPVRGW